MSFFDTSHTNDSPLSPAPIETRDVSFGEGFDIGYEQQYRVDSPYSLDYEIKNLWDEQLKLYERETGVKLAVPFSVDALGQYARTVQGQEQSFTAKTISGDVAPEVQANITQLQQANEKIKALGNSNIRSFDEVLAEVIQMQKEVEGRTNEIGLTFGSLIGGIAGSFSERDPVSVATLGVGGAGRTVVGRIATEMALAGGIAAATDAVAVNPNRETAGLEQRSVVQDALFAALGAGVFQGGAEGLVKLARALEPVDRQVARALRNAEIPDVQDDITRAALAAFDESPRARAGLSILDDVEAIEAASPYGPSHQGVQRFLAELEEVQRALGNVPQTAVARTLPPMPIEQLERAADFELVKERSPDVWQRLEDAKAKVAQVQAVNINEFRVNPNNPAEKHLLYRSPTTGEEIDVRINVKEDGTAEIDIGDITDLDTVNRLGPAEVSLVGQAIQQRYPEIMQFTGERLTGAGKDRVATVRVRQTVQREYEQALTAVEKERDAINRVAQLTKRQGEADSIDLLGNSVGLRPFFGSGITHEVAERQMDAVAQIADSADDRALAQMRMLEDPEGRIDIGMEEMVDGDFKIVTEDGEFSIREIMDDLKEDEKLDFAMRNCLL